jgi:hypothetical protein
MLQQSFYRSLCVYQVRDFEHQYAGEVAAGTSLAEYQKRFRQDPAPLIAAILIVAQAQLLRRASPESLSPRGKWYLFKLQAFLNRIINAALGDPTRATSDQLLIAVSICATYEVRQANLEGYRIHMAGLRQMIELRGGFAGFGRSDPYLGRFLLWQDANTASVAGLVLILEISLEEVHYTHHFSRFSPFFDKMNDDATIRAQLQPDPTLYHTNIPLADNG